MTLEQLAKLETNTQTIERLTKERDELRTQLEAWNEAFGTTQLTHAISRLLFAENDRDAAMAKVAELRLVISDAFPPTTLVGDSVNARLARERIEHALSGDCGDAFVRFKTPTLHPMTAKLVIDFAKAMADKLAAAEKKYGYSDGWAYSNGGDWPDPICYEELARHLEKGDPRDVANYCAFLWYHKLSTKGAIGHLPAAMRESLVWALKQLDRLVSIHEDGSAFAKKSGHEIVGYALRYERARNALSNTPPKGWMSPDKAKVLVEALELIGNECGWGSFGRHGEVCAKALAVAKEMGL